MADVPERPLSPGSNRWTTWFQTTTEPLFVLNPRRRLRFVNRAWESLTGYSADEAIGWGCSGRRQSETSPIAVVMRPTREAMDGQLSRVRRAVPPARSGPPWWDITFIPIPGESGLLGILGKIRVIGPSAMSGSKAKGLAESLMAIRFEHAQHYPLVSVGGESPLAARLEAQLRLAIAHRFPVWLHGERGTGKRMIARVIHHHGPTRDKTFASVDCRSLPAAMIAGMLFSPGGLMRSSTVGTILFREPAALSRDVQERIAEGLNESPDEMPRIIVASTQPPTKEWSEGNLLPEFFAAIGVAEILAPPLRERLEELPSIISPLLERLHAAGVPAISGIAPEVMELMRGYEWPGNLDDLESVLQQAIDAAHPGRLEVHHLPRPFREASFRPQQSPPLPNSSQPPFLALELILEQVERRLITRAMRQSKGNRTEAAELLGVTRTELWRRLKALHIEES